MDGANRHDVKLARDTVEEIEVKRPRPTKKKKQNLCLDAGYVGDEIQELANEFGFTLHVRPRGEEAQEIKRSGCAHSRYMPTPRWGERLLPERHSGSKKQWNESFASHFPVCQ